MSLLTRSIVLADVAPPEGRTSNFNYCVKIGNLKKYPNSLFFAQIQAQNAATASPYILIRADRCLEMSGYRPMINIATIAKNKVATKDLKKSGTETVLVNPKIHKSLVKYQEPIYRPHSVPSINEGKNIIAVYDIKSIGKTTLDLTPVDSALKISNLIIFPVIGLTILCWLVWKRRHQIAS